MGLPACLLVCVQDLAQMRDKSFDEDMIVSAAQAAHRVAHTAVKRLPGIHWLAQEVGGAVVCMYQQPHMACTCQEHTLNLLVDHVHKPSHYVVALFRHS